MLVILEQMLEVLIQLMEWEAAEAAGVWTVVLETVEYIKINNMINSNYLKI